MAADDGVVRRTLGVLGLVAALTATTTAMLPAAWGQAPSASAVASSASASPPAPTGSTDDAAAPATPEPEAKATPEITAIDFDQSADWGKKSSRVVPPQAAHWPSTNVMVAQEGQA